MRRNYRSSSEQQRPSGSTARPTIMARFFICRSSMICFEILESAARCRRCRMRGIIDADTHISEGAAMWALMDKSMQPRRPIMLSVPDDTWYGNRNAFWLIDGEIYPKPAGRGSFALVTP